MECPFQVGEIVVFESTMRMERYIARLQPMHIVYWGAGFIPKITKATTEQKQMWYENGEEEMILELITI